MSTRYIDILMITYNRPMYTQLALDRLLRTCDKSMRVWVWQNGSDKRTLKVVESFKKHPCFYMFNHSAENVKLTIPTNWLWENSDADYFAKVDDDCLMPEGWGRTLQSALDNNSDFGVVSCWLYWPNDIIYSLAKKKLFISGNCSLLQNCWVGGSGYLMRRECVEQQGLLKQNKSFSYYCICLWESGWKNGWYWPVLHMEHMDDPRSKHCMLKTDADVKALKPLSAQTFEISTLEEWGKKLADEAKYVQMASLDWRAHCGRKDSLRLDLKRWINALRQSFRTSH